MANGTEVTGRYPHSLTGQWQADRGQKSGSSLGSCPLRPAQSAPVSLLADLFTTMPATEDVARRKQNAADLQASLNNIQLPPFRVNVIFSPQVTKSYCSC